MLGRLRKLVDIRSGEGRPAILATVVLFAMVAGHMMLETARDALFLGKLDAARLPLVYAALAGLAVFAIHLSDRVVARAGRRNAVVTTLVLAIYGTVIFYMLPRSGPMVFALYLWSGLIGSVVVIQFWIFVGQLFTVGQAKRLFGLIAAGGALGALVGASVAAVVVRHFEVDILLVVGAGMFMVSALALTTFPSDPTAGQVEAPTREPGLSPAVDTKQSAGAVFRRFPYLWRLGGLIIIATVTVLIVDYMFKQGAARRLEPDELGGFFATYYAIFSAVSLVFQLVGAPWLLSRLGILSSLLIMPLLIAVGGAATVVFAGALFATIATKGADGALRHSLHRVTTELLWMPLPGWARARAKGLFDSGLTRGVQAGTAAGLLALGTFGLDNSVVLGGIVAGLGAVWLMLAISMRRPYLELYRSSLARSSASAIIDLNLKSLEVLVEALSSADDDEVIAAMKLLAAKGRARLIPSLILYHSSPRVLGEALALVATDDRRDWVPIARKLMSSESDEVRTAALRALARRGKLTSVDDRTLDISPQVRAQTVFWRIQRQERTDMPIASMPAVAEIIERRGAGADEAISELLISIAHDGDTRWADVVMSCLEVEDVEIAMLAVEATSTLRDPRFLPLLIGRLGQRDGRGAVREALLAIGDPALDALELAFRDINTDRQVRMHLPRSVALFGSKRAAFILLEQLNREQDGAVRFRILTVLANMAVDLSLTVPHPPIIAQLDRNLREYFRLLALQAPLERKTYEMPSEAVESAGLLHDLIADKMRQALERCFLLLQITHPREDLAGITAALDSSDSRVRANAVEFVENMTSDLKRVDGSVDVRRLLTLALDTLPTEAKVSRAGDIVRDRPKTYDESILALARDDDETTAAIAVYHALLLDVVHLRAEVADLVDERPLLAPLGPELHSKLLERSEAG